MDKILYLDHVDQYNRLYGLETLHPLVSVINLNEATRAVGTIRRQSGIYKPTPMASSSIPTCFAARH